MSKFFTISVGNNGVVLLLRNKKKVLQQLFFQSINDEETKKTLTDLFKQNSKLPIYIVLDNIGQNYNKRIFPAVSFFDALKIVNRKFNFEIPRDDLKEKIYLGRSLAGEWEYMFVSSPIDGYLHEWIEFIGQIDNILGGIYMLPLEFENILKKINKKLNIKKHKERGWTIVLVENKVSGLREMTFTNNRLTFTRILQDDLIDATENFAKNFKESIYRTFEYLKRFYPDFDIKNVTMYTITSPNSQSIISSSNITDFKIKSFSFNELAVLLGSGNSVHKDTEHGDLLFQNLIVDGKKVVSFSTREMKQLAVISSLNKIFSKFIYVLLAMLVILVIHFLITTIINGVNLRYTKNKLEAVEAQLAKSKETEFGMNENDFNKIVDIASFYVDMKNLKVDPFNFLIKFSSMVEENIVVTDIVWKISDFKKHVFNARGKFTYIIDSVMVNKSGKIDDLFKLYDSLDKTFKNSLENYSVTLTSLPKNINFNVNYFSFPLKISFVEN
ncbi:MAG: hypothetical protein LBS34_00475 [Rickettsiales bacterium]|jgi:hypothetical protein|nr:hypothetical protein [Rickettsiales bacterium]